MGFGYKTAWIAVRSRSTAEVADALTLGDRRTMGYADGTRAAYTQGVFVAPPVGDWTLAHGRELFEDINPTEPDFLAWLATMSRQLDEVQYFGTYRVAEAHHWAAAQGGIVTRAYVFVDGAVSVAVGEPTAAEITCNIGIETDPGEEARTWGDAEWDRWFAAMPDEHDVMRLAGLWSVDPSEIDDNAVAGTGLYGTLTWHRPTPSKARRLRPPVPPTDH